MSDDDSAFTIIFSLVILFIISGIIGFIHMVTLPTLHTFYYEMNHVSSNDATKTYTIKANLVMQRDAVLCEVHSASTADSLLTILNGYKYFNKD